MKTIAVIRRIEVPSGAYCNGNETCNHLHVTRAMIQGRRQEVRKCVFFNKALWYSESGLIEKSDDCRKCKITRSKK